MPDWLDQPQKAVFGARLTRVYPYFFPDCVPNAHKVIRMPSARQTPC